MDYKEVNQKETDSELVLIENKEPSPIKLKKYIPKTLQDLYFNLHTVEDCVGGWDNVQLENLVDIGVSNVEKLRITFVFTNKFANYATSYFTPRNEIDITDFGAVREYFLSVVKQEIFNRTNTNYFNPSSDYETKLYNSIYKIINGFDNDFILTLHDGASYKDKFLFFNSKRNVITHYLENKENPRLMRKITMKVIKDIKENRGIEENAKCCIC